jgi:hypothetical protein
VHSIYYVSTIKKFIGKISFSKMTYEQDRFILYNKLCGKLFIWLFLVCCHFWCWN